MLSLRTGGVKRFSALNPATRINTAEVQAERIKVKADS